ncbi:MAG: nitroreductase [Alphaproteobacteria bacterium]|jgi:nitroreductase
MSTDVFENMLSRRSVGKVTQDAVAPELIEKIIEAGTYAPAHKRTDPWRFSIFTGDGRKELACAMANGFAASQQGFDGYERKLEMVSRKAFRAPVIILVWCAAARGKVNPPLWEDHAATSACLQNMSLAAHALGLGSVWRTSGAVNWPEVQALCTCENDSFDAKKGDKIMGMLYLGHKDEQYPEPTRQPEKPQITYYT